MSVGIQGRVLLKRTGKAGLEEALLATVCARRTLWTYKVPARLPHPVSHVDHHAVEQAERVPRRVLENGKG